MFQNRTIINAVEIGTSKITVLVGESKADGQVDIIGVGEVPSAGVAKGEIANMEKTFEQLSLALDAAEIASNGALNDSCVSIIPVTGCGISTSNGVGSLYINHEDRKITEEDRYDAYMSARGQMIEPERTILNSSESFFIIDGVRRLRNPLNQTASKLEAHVHIVHGLTNRLENFKTVIRESGYEEGGDIVFSPLASAIGILSEEERENGVLLVDMGAGATEYMIEFNTGVLHSGMIQIGFDHLINDLCIGLNLKHDVCKKLINSGKLNEHILAKDDHIDFPAGSGKIRRIPLSSFETIINCRLRELFSIIRKSINDEATLANLNSGAVLTGGGAMFELTPVIFREIFDMSVRVGYPFGLSGSITGLDNPRYSTVWGALKIADYYARINSQNTAGPLRRLLSGVDGVVNKMRQAMDDFKSSFKI